MPSGTFLLAMKVQLDRIFILQNCSYYWETLTWLSWPLLQVFPWQRCSQSGIGPNPNHRKSMLKLLCGSVFSMLPARSKHWPKHCSQNPPFVSWSIAPGAFSAQRVYLRNKIACVGFAGKTNDHQRITAQRKRRRTIHQSFQSMELPRWPEDLFFFDRATLRA